MSNHEQSEVVGGPLDGLDVLYVPDSHTKAPVVAFPMSGNSAKPIIGRTLRRGDRAAVCRLNPTSGKFDYICVITYTTDEALQYYLQYEQDKKENGSY